MVDELPEVGEAGRDVGASPFGRGRVGVEHRLCELEERVVADVERRQLGNMRPNLPGSPWPSSASSASGHLARRVAVLGAGGGGRASGRSSGSGLPLSVNEACRKRADATAWRAPVPVRPVERTLVDGGWVARLSTRREGVAPRPGAWPGD